jgi:ribosomal protein S18 acetylase RimI-like enzyme
MTVEIREARPDEYALAGEVTANAYREFVREGDADWEEYLQRIADVEERAARTVILVAVEDARIIGSGTLELDGRTDDAHGALAPGEAHVRMLGVDPAARGRGVGRLLVTACEHRARDAGRTLISLDTTQRMEVAGRMYESLGYVRGEDEVLPDGFVLLRYTKHLV